MADAGDSDMRPAPYAVRRLSSMGDQRDIAPLPSAVVKSNIEPPSFA